MATKKKPTKKVAKIETIKLPAEPLNTVVYDHKVYQRQENGNYIAKGESKEVKIIKG